MNDQSGLTQAFEQNTRSSIGRFSAREKAHPYRAPLRAHLTKLREYNKDCVFHLNIYKAI
jgi:hypothetical protein